VESSQVSFISAFNMKGNTRSKKTRIFYDLYGADGFRQSTLPQLAFVFSFAPWGF